MSTSTETDVAVSESGTVMVSDTVARSGMVRWGDLVCVNCPVEVDVLSPPRTVRRQGKVRYSPLPVTSSLKVAL